MLMNKKEVIIVIISMIVGFGLFILGFAMFSLLGLGISFIGSMMVLLPLLFIGIKIHSRKKVISVILIILSSLGICVMINDFIFDAIKVYIQIMNGN